jgi:uncharacterized membrane protein
MHRKHKYDIVVVLGVLGLGVSLFLAISHYLGYAVPCDITGGCEAVLNSKYSTLLGIPLSIWGIGYFAAVIVSALLANHYLQWRKVVTVILSIGALLGLVFLSIQFFVIKKVCQYCLATDLLSILLFILDINIERKD